MKTTSELLARAARAKALIEDDLFKDAFETLKAEILKAWLQTDRSETEARERLWVAYQNVEDIRLLIHTHIQNGKIAQAEINKLGGVNRLAA